MNSLSYNITIDLAKYKYWILGISIAFALIIGIVESTTEFYLLNSLPEERDELFPIKDQTMYMINSTHIHGELTIDAVEKVTYDNLFSNIKIVMQLINVSIIIDHNSGIYTRKNKQKIEITAEVPIIGEFFAQFALFNGNFGKIYSFSAIPINDSHTKIKKSSDNQISFVNVCIKKHISKFILLTYFRKNYSTNLYKNSVIKDMLISNITEYSKINSNDKNAAILYFPTASSYWTQLKEAFSLYQKNKDKTIITTVDSLPIPFIHINREICYSELSIPDPSLINIAQFNFEKHSNAPTDDLIISYMTNMNTSVLKNLICPACDIISFDSIEPKSDFPNKFIKAKYLIGGHSEYLTNSIFMENGVLIDILNKDQINDRWIFDYYKHTNQSIVLYVSDNQTDYSYLSNAIHNISEKCNFILAINNSIVEMCRNKNFVN